MNPREHGNSLFNRDGLNLLSTRSRWARVGRYYREVGQWDQDVAAIAQVDASTLEAYSYHPAPINDVRYSVDVTDQIGKLARDEAREVLRLRNELSRLVAEQDQLWRQHGDFDSEQRARWADLEAQIREIKDRLTIEFEQRVEAGSNWQPAPVKEDLRPQCTHYWSDSERCTNKINGDGEYCGTHLRAYANGSIWKQISDDVKAGLAKRANTERRCTWCGAPSSYFVSGDRINDYACSGHANAAYLAGLKVESVGA